MTFSIKHGLVLALLSSLGIRSTGEDGFSESGLFVASDICGPEFVGCEEAGPCFDHTTGICLEDGNVTLVDCEEAFAFCQTCFPNSRCGSTEAAPVDESAMFVESDICGPDFAGCAEAGPCFDHTSGACFEDGSVIGDCLEALPCGPCFPNSRCGSTEALTVDESGMFVESDICGPLLAQCAEAGPCFDHTTSCQEDGTFSAEECNQALPFCAPCFPNSRCGSLKEDEAADAPVEAADAPVEAADAPVEATTAPVEAPEPFKAPVAEEMDEEMEGTLDDEASASGIRSVTTALPAILVLVAVLSW